MTLLLAAPALAGNPFPVTQSFEGTTVPSPPWYMGGSATLTGTASTLGWLRLTSASGNQFGYVINDTAFPSASGILSSFDYASYGGTGADGLTFFLYDGSTSKASFSPGPAGGDLGYASCPSTPQAGLTNAYIGVGFDEYGNFSNTGFCGLTTGYAAGLNPERITVRGAAGASPSAGNSYPYLTSAAVAAGETLIGASEADSRHVTLSISPSGKLSVYVAYPDGTLQKVVAGYQLPALPGTLKFGWVASTGGSTDFHEIRNSLTAEPAELQTIASGPASASRSSTLTYTFTVTNKGENPTTANAITATSPSSLQNISWTCTSTTGTCGAASGSGLPSTTADLPVGASATYTITAQPSSSTDYAKLTLEADPTGPYAQSVPGENIASATTYLTPQQASGASAAPAMTLSNTNGYTGTATGTQGTYLGGNLTITDNWQHCAPDGTGCADITGATGLSYTTGTADRGYTLRLHEHVSNPAGSTDDYSAYYTPLPTTSVPTGPAYVTNQTSASFTLSSNTAGAAFECSLDGAAYGSCTSSPSYAGLSNGTHTLRARAVWGGLSDPTGASYTWLVDTVAPTDTSTCGSAGTGGWWTSTTPCTVQGTDAGSGVNQVQWYIDAGATQSGASGSTPTFTNGTHTLHTRVEDNAGNYSAWRTFTVKIDATAPVDTSTCGAPNGLNGYFISAPTCTVQGSDAVSGLDHVAYQLDSGAVTSTASGTTTATVTVSGDGLHTLKTEVFNVAGLSSGWTSHTINLDSTAPSDTSTCGSAGTGGWWTSTTPCAVQGTDSGSGVAQVQWYIDAGATQSGPSGSAPTIANGMHTLHTRVEDNAGNYSSWRTFTVKVDATVPTDTSSCPAPGGQNGWYVSAPSCTVQGSDAVSGIDHVAYQLDSGAVTSTASGTTTATVTVSGDGTHTLKTEVFNVAGLVSGWSTRTLKVEAAPPSDKSTCGTPDGQNGYFVTPPTCTVQGSDPVSGIDHVAYQLDSGAVTTTASGTTTATVTISGDGTHTLKTEMFNVAGQNSGWLTQTIKLDTTAPAAPVVSAPANGSYTNQSKPPVTLTAEPGSTDTIYIDGTAVGITTADASGNASFTPSTPLADGAHAVKATATDAAGNISTDSNVNTFTVKTSIGVPTVVSPANGSFSSNTSPTVVVSGEPGDSATVVVDGTSYGPVTLDGLGNGQLRIPGPLSAGQHQVKVQQSDLAGNTSAFSATSTWSVKTQTTVHFTNPPSGQTTNAQPTFAYSGEPGDQLTLSVDGQVVATGAVGPSGSGQLQLPAALGTGTHTIAITATDPAGNTASDSTVITVDSPSSQGNGPGSNSPSSQPAGPAMDVSPATISGTPLPGNALACHPGTWTGNPTSFAYQWYRSTSPVYGATGAQYAVQVADEGLALACHVTAINRGGTSKPVASAGVVVAVKGTLNCPKPRGRIAGTTVGPLTLAMRPATARHILRRYVITKNHFDDFCLYAGWGIRVGYPSPTLLSFVTPAQRSKIAGKGVMVLTANPFYSLHGARTGMTVTAVKRLLRLTKPFHIGLNYWYVAPLRGVANGVLKVRAGVIQEVGLVNKQLTGSHKAQSVLLHSFH